MRKIVLMLLLAVVSNSAMAGSWSYEKHVDEMTGKKTTIASKTSVNTVEFGFPYQGKQRATIFIIEDKVAISIEKGQLNCRSEASYNSCTVLLKFDDEDATPMSAWHVGDDSTSLQLGGANFIDNVKKSKRLKIQVSVYQNGTYVFNFDVRNFEQR